MDNRRRLSSTEIAQRIRRWPTESAFSGGFRGVGQPDRASSEAFAVGTDGGFRVVPGSGEGKVFKAGGWNAGEGVHVGLKGQVGHHVGPGVEFVGFHEANHRVAEDVGFNCDVP